MVASLDIKAMLRHMDIQEHTAMFDAGIAAYLLNPLKSQYTYDDIAKEYLGEILPAKEDLIGKLTYLKAAKDESYEQEVAKSICYMAYVALKIQKASSGGSGGYRNEETYLQILRCPCFLPFPIWKRKGSG